MTIEEGSEDYGQLINATSVKQIDWDSMHTQQQKHTSFIRTGKEHWDKYARSPVIGEIDHSYIDELIPRMKLSPEMSVLDAGCGNGGISIELARRVRQVVALDSSPAAIESLQNKIREHNCENINTILADFSRADVGKDIEICDVVLASRSMPMGNLRQSLIKVDRAARQLCYLVSGAGENELTSWICSEIGMEYHPFPEYLITPNLLYTMGIHANIEIFDVTGTYEFGDVEQVMSFAMLGSKVPERNRETIKKLLLSRVVERNGCYIYTYHKKFALIWWRKE